MSDSHLLRIDTRGPESGAISRHLGDRVQQHLMQREERRLVRRELAEQPLPLVDEAWLSAAFTAEEQLDTEQQAMLAPSAEAIDELANADAVIVTAPMHNFGVPALLKAWIDQICRAGMTFRYTSEGPEGLLQDRPVYLVLASGGVPVGSDMDFMSAYLRQVFAFVGITDLHIIAAEQMNVDAESSVDSAYQQIDALFA